MKNKLPNIQSFSPEEFVNQSTAILVKLIQDLTSEKSIINIALSGGSSPMPIYEKLRFSDLKWDCINFFIVDERCVTNEDEQSNFGNINKRFFSHISSNCFPVVKEGVTYQEAATNYQELIMHQVKNADGIPQFDLIILGLGLDGHTASLFPETMALNNTKDLMILNNVPQLKTNRITMTYPLILNSKKIVLIAKGSDKKKILDNVFKNEYPISKIIPKIYTILN